MSSVKENIAKNIKWLSLTNLIVKILKVITLIGVTRLISPDQYGLFVYLVSSIGLCYFFSDLGLRTIMQKEFHAHHDQASLGTLMLLRGGLALTALGISFCLPTVIPTLKASSTYYWLCAYGLTLNIKEFLFTYTRFYEQPIIEFKTRTLNAVLELGLLVAFFLLISPSIFSLGLAFSCAGLISMAYFTNLTLPLFRKTSWSFDINYAKSLLGRYKKLSASSMLYETSRYIDVIIMERLLGLSEVSLLDIAKRIFTLPNHVPSIIIQAAIPNLSQAQHDVATLRRVLERSIMLILLVMCPMALGLAIIDEPLITLALTPSYWGAIGLLNYYWILVITTPIDKVVSTALLLNSHPEKIATIKIVVIVISLLSLAPFIYVFGIIGSVLAFITKSLLLIIIVGNSLRKELTYSTPFKHSLLAIALASLLAAFGMLITGEHVALAALKLFWVYGTFYGVLFLTKNSYLIDYSQFIRSNLSSSLAYYFRRR